MAVRLQNKISMDVAADSSSLDSFSFAGLLCVQDQQSKCLTPNRGNQIHKQGTDFEFAESTVTDPIKHYPADLLISNGKILPKAVALPSPQKLAAHQPSITGPVRAKPTSRRRSTHTPGGTEVSAKPNPEFRTQEKKKPATRSGFGQKLFKSFLFPCKECQAVKPTKRAHRTPEANGKSH